jgi:four helix bundle protein
LEERTAKFGEDIIISCKKVPRDEITKSLVSQLIKSGTSVEANYCEADCAESRKDFEHKLSISKKEAKESKHWLRMIAKAIPDLKNGAKLLWKESNELQLIPISIIKKSKANSVKKRQKINF